MIVGDLNFVLHNSEKEGGNDMNSSAITVIQNVIQQIGFIDLKFTGDLFTWSNQREGADNIRERIDRSLVNVIWFQCFPDALVHHLTRMDSDHNHLLIVFDPCKVKKKRPYRFFRGWNEHKDYNMFIENAWKMLKMRIDADLHDLLVGLSNDFKD
ncbi:uncharacterized protein LOC113315625 [Papaver somniferum]|uniref:uncharacterized protein LOC113315625 n=1 Tax=Papaver somniferum TaxID=3469 RepID=UPI000E6F517D|nr:uncharacterized protein LOC113315625 [Papaver somniferum]